MGKPSRDKGLRRERAIVDIHMKCGLRAERVPLSGALRYRGNGADVDLYVRGAEPLKAEVKARGEGDGFKTLVRDRIRQVGPNKTGAKGSFTVYALAE